MRLENDKVLIRKMVASDIDDVICWNTVETEWMKWDAPWEHEISEEYDWDAYRVRKTEEIHKDMDDIKLQMRLEVCICNKEETHIGAVSCYFLDDDYRIDDKGAGIAIGMDICEAKYRGNGYGSSTYRLYLAYLKELGYKTVYTQTWSGNLPLIKMALKLGFQECNRYIGIRSVRGKRYDGLTFKIML